MITPLEQRKVKISQIFKLRIILLLQAYYREGVALQALGKDAEALASLASGLAADPKSTQLLTAMVETAIRSPLKGTSQKTFTS